MEIAVTGQPLSDYITYKQLGIVGYEAAMCLELSEHSELSGTVIANTLTALQDVKFLITLAQRQQLQPTFLPRRRNENPQRDGMFVVFGEYYQKHDLEGLREWLMTEWVTEEDVIAAIRTAEQSPLRGPVGSLQQVDFVVPVQLPSDLLVRLRLEDSVIPEELVDTIFTEIPVSVATREEWQLPSTDSRYNNHRLRILGDALRDLAIVTEVVQQHPGDNIGINAARIEYSNRERLSQRLTTAEIPSDLREARASWLAVIGIYYYFADWSEVREYILEWLRPDEQSANIRSLPKGYERRSLSSFVLSNIAQLPENWCEELRKASHPWEAFLEFYRNALHFTPVFQETVTSGRVELYGRFVDIRKGVSLPLVITAPDRVTAQQLFAEEVLHRYTTTCSEEEPLPKKLRNMIRSRLPRKWRERFSTRNNSWETLANFYKTLGFPFPSYVKQLVEGVELYARFLDIEKWVSLPLVVTAPDVATARYLFASQVLQWYRDPYGKEDQVPLRKLLHLEGEPWDEVSDELIAEVFDRNSFQFEDWEYRGDEHLDLIVLRMLGGNINLNRRLKIGIVRNTTLYCLMQARNLCCRVTPKGGELLRVKGCADVFEALLGMLYEVLNHTRGDEEVLDLLQQYLEKYWFTTEDIMEVRANERLDNCWVGDRDVREVGLGGQLPPCPKVRVPPPGQE